MLNNLKKHSFLPAVRRWDNMFDSVMGKLDLFPGEELRSELDAYIHPDIEVSENYVNIRMALPGYTKDEIEVEIENDLQEKISLGVIPFGKKSKKLVNDIDADDLISVVGEAGIYDRVKDPTPAWVIITRAKESTTGFSCWAFSFFLINACLTRTIFQSSGICPIHSIPLSFICFILSSPNT